MRKNTLVDLDGVLCVKCESNDYTHPIRQVCWYRIGQRTSTFVRNYGKERLNADLKEGAPGTFYDDCNTRYVLEMGGKTMPCKGEGLPIPEPVQRGRKLPAQYRAGRWEKLTRNGWVAM